MIEATRDALFDGAVVLRQPARKAGYRVNADALLLAAFVARKKAHHAIDLGAGVGAVGLSLLHFGAAERVTMIEIDPALAELARSNAEENAWTDRIDVIDGDVAAAPSLGGDIVVCNPPYVPPGRGRPPAARHRTARLGSVEAFVDAARRVAGKRAHVAFVYPAIEATTLLSLLRARGLEPKRLRPVHGRAGDAARVVLVEAVPGKPGGLVIEPALIETTGDPIATLLQRARA